MSDALQAALLGVIEGVTEFLPVSSTGHLLIAEHWLGRRSELFNVAIQSGAILAVVLVFWERLRALVIGWREPAQHDYLVKLILAVGITLAGGFAAKQLGLALPESVTPVAIALIAGGVAILAIEALVAKRPQSGFVSWQAAVWVGLAQLLAGLVPGTSRSAATIFAALLAGVTARPAAAEFAFLVGIPTMLAATGYELLRLRGTDTALEDFTALGIGFAVAAVVALIVVRWLMRYIQTHRFTLFAWYRIAAGAALLYIAR